MVVLNVKILNSIQINCAYLSIYNISYVNKMGYLFSMLSFSLSFTLSARKIFCWVGDDRPKPRMCPLQMQAR